MSKARKHLEAVREDLAQMRTNDVQARVIIGFCDDGGVPRHKNKWFIVTPRVGRQVEVAGKKQDRSLLHSDCKTWNWIPGAKGGPNWVQELKGQTSIRIRLQHIDIEDAYDVGCRCQADPTGAVKPPGKSPYCISKDMETARRWTRDGVIDMECLKAECPLRYRHRDAKDREFTPAKTEFVLVGMLDEDGLPPLIVSTMTGSAYNLAQFNGMLESVESQWHKLCHPPQVDPSQHINIPLSWYNIPILLTVYESSDGGGRYPRIHYTLGCPLEDVFDRMREFVARAVGHHSNLLAAGMAPLQLSAGTMTESFRDLDADEVLSPMPVDAPTPAPSRLSPMTTIDIPATPTAAPTQAEATPPAPVRIDFTTGKDLRRQIVAAMEGDDQDTIVELLEVTATKGEAKPESRNGMAKVWAEFAPAIHEAHPGLSELLTSIGCPAPEPKQEEPEAATPPAEEHPFNEPAAPLATTPQVVALAPATPKRSQLEAVEDYGQQLMASEDKATAYFFRKLLAEFSNNLDGDARMRWETIRRQKLGK